MCRTGVTLGRQTRRNGVLKAAALFNSATRVCLPGKKCRFIVDLDGDRHPSHAVEKQTRAPATLFALHSIFALITRSDASLNSRFEQKSRPTPHWDQSSRTRYSRFCPGSLASCYRPMEALMVKLSLWFQTPDPRADSQKRCFDGGIEAYEGKQWFPCCTSTRKKRAKRQIQIRVHLAKKNFAFSSSP